MVMEVVHEDMGDGYMHCVNHRYKNSTPGGICAFCLQEKLGKLVSSSFPVAVFPSSSSSTPRSDYLASSSLSSQSVDRGANRGVDCSYSGYYSRRSRLPFYLPHLKKKKDSSTFVLNRSKSTATPRRCVDENYAEDLSPRKRRLWSFFYSSKHGNSKTYEHQNKDSNFSSATLVGSSSSNAGSLRPVLDKKKEDFLVMDVNGSPDEASLDRKVSRSRSVGCGSKSFSGDFFERISTGFGDCSLRRVESQREGKHKTTPSAHGHGVKCVGIFGGFMVPSSSSSASTEENHVNGKSFHSAHLSYGKFKSWGLTLASPMRVIGKRAITSSKNATPDLGAIPSLLASTL